MYFNSEDFGPEHELSSTCAYPPHTSVSTVSQSVVTVLTSVISQVNPHLAPPLNKRYYLDTDTGKLKLENYQNGFLFTVEEKPVNSIRDFATLLADISSDNRKMIIRGLRVNKSATKLRRTNENFAEHPDGTFFVMLDFDSIATEKDPLSIEAIESVIDKLPSEFQNVTYYYQHSNSAGVLDEDGKPKKAGLNAHVFFWLNRRIPGPELTAYLKKHCMDTGFYRVGEDKGGTVKVTYGIDPAPIYSAVQAHYIASPTIEAGVACSLNPSQRQGLVSKSSDVVCVPVIPDNVEAETSRLAASVKWQYEKEHGYVHRLLQTRTENGMALHTYSVNPNAQNRTGRTLIDTKLSHDGQFLVLFFDEENSPGSWFVSKLKPHFAQRYGDGERIPLKEFSESAHQHVRDDLKWFTEIPHHNRALVDGYVPAIKDFAEARVSMILAPTGSGKTTSAIAWIRDKLREKILVVYAAPTIALVNQTKADLDESSIPCMNYRDVWRGNLASAFVIVTTNKSLRKILGLANDAMLPYYLICDEIHSGLDEFMRSNNRNAFFEQAMLKAKQTLLLTATLTNVQKLGLPQVVGHALSSLSEANYCCYEFQPFKSNPLYLYPSDNFKSDFIGLMQDLKQKAEQGMALPRVAILLPTSKLNAYRNILNANNLERYAHVVSRPENSQEDIDAARTSDLPILIASPLFGVGINLNTEPDMLWANFDRLKADTNHIIQTVNRANRGQVNCEVRIYGDTSKDSEFKLTPRHALKAEVAERLRRESSFVGVLEEHLQIDRNTYQCLRTIERDSGKSLSYLEQHNLIQNYTIMEAQIAEATSKKNEEIFLYFLKAARDHYNQDVYEQAQRYSKAELDLLFWKLEKLDEERKTAYLMDNPRVDREIENEVIGVVMVLCGLDAPPLARKVKVSKIQRLFGEIGPWISAQYDAEKCPDWAKVQAEKTESIVVLLNKLGEIQAGTISVRDLVASLSRNKRLGEAFMALADYDQEYLRISNRFIDFIKCCRYARDKGSDNLRAKVKKVGTDQLEELLEPLGVFFERVTVGRKTIINYDKLLVPHTWNLPVMADNLTKQALRLKALHPDQKVIVLSDEESDHKSMPREICEQCIMYHKMACVLGHPVDWCDVLLPRSRATSCDSFKGIEIKVAA